MSQHHHHHTNTEDSGNKLLITVVLNFTITLAEFIGGIFSNSLALISDAVHNLSDSLALFITYITNRISKRASNQEHTFGYKRIQILAALFNSVSLIAICIYLLYEAYLRFANPEPVKSLIMFVVAFVGLIANLVSVMLLKKHSEENLNIKAAYLHLIGDTLSSVAVIIGGVLMFFYQLYWIDPLITVFISLYIIKETYSVLYETYKILMQVAPANMNIDMVVEEILTIPDVSGVHHIHIWQLTDNQVHFEGHLDLKKDLHVSKCQEIIDLVQKKLHDKFDIEHVTLQLEFNRCDNKEIINQEKHI
ncbi:MAG TPA: cation diffusion facilitator family transporter [Bacteroidales bacterium]